MSLAVIGILKAKLIKLTGDFNKHCMLRTVQEPVMKKLHWHSQVGFKPTTSGVHAGADVVATSNAEMAGVEWPILIVYMGTATDVLEKMLQPDTTFDNKSIIAESQPDFCIRMYLKYFVHIISYGIHMKIDS